MRKNNLAQLLPKFMRTSIRIAFDVLSSMVKQQKTRMQIFAVSPPCCRHGSRSAAKDSTEILFFNFGANTQGGVGMTSQKRVDYSHCFIWCLIFLVVTCSFSIMNGTAFAANLTLAWDANSEPDLTGYRVYCGESSGNYNPSLTKEVPATTLVKHPRPPTNLPV